MQEWFDKWWPTMLTAAVSGVLAAFWRQLKLIKKWIEGLKVSNMVQNRDRISQKCNYHIRLGYLPMQERVDLVDMYDAYIGMGGKASLGDLVAQARALPTEKKEDS